MKHKLVLTLALVAALAAAFFGGTLYRGAAQPTFTEQDVIDLAAGSPQFAAGLANTPGWTAAAYDTQNAYGIWRVTFWNAGGDEIGWADLNPARGKVYSWDAHFGATDAQRDAAYDVVRAFIINHPDILELLESPDYYDIYVDWDSWNKAWGAYIARPGNALWMLVKFDGDTPDSFDNPRLLGLWFADVLSYSEWQEASEAKAVAAAFQNADVAAVLAGTPNWTTTVEKQDERIWRVIFLDGDTVLASVTVDLNTGSVTDYTIGE